MPVANEGFRLGSLNLKILKVILVVTGILGWGVDPNHIKIFQAIMVVLWTPVVVAIILWILFRKWLKFCNPKQDHPLFGWCLRSYFKLQVFHFVVKDTMLGNPRPWGSQDLKISRRGTQLVNAADVTLGVGCVGLGWVGWVALLRANEEKPFRSFLDGNFWLGVGLVSWRFSMFFPSQKEVVKK